MLLNRDSLKALFKKGTFPTENHFAHLIDSSVNKLDDGIAKTPKDGLQLSPQGDFNRVLSVFDHMGDSIPAWQVQLKKDAEASGLSFEKIEKDENNLPVSTSSLFLGDDGKIGFHTATPELPFEVNATAGLKTRIGTLARGQVPGDGEWHTVLGGLNGLMALEVVARIDGPPKKGKYAITHGIAVSSYGGKQAKNKIKQTRSYYGWFWNRIEMRWTGDTKDYALQIRTRQHYGLDDDNQLSMIRFHITSLWDEKVMSSNHLPIIHASIPEIDPKASN